MSPHAPRASFAYAIPCLLLHACGAPESSSSASAPAVVAPPTLSAIDARVFRPLCTAACHSGGDNAAGGLDLSRDLHASLVAVPATAAACADGELMRVVAGRADASLLYQKITAKMAARDPACGDGMPVGEERPAVPAADAELVRAWIEGGAKND